MDQGLKERLIGAAVLVALGVWLIPWLLDGRPERLGLDSSSSALRLPAPDGPLPVRSATLALETAKRDAPGAGALPAETHAEPATLALAPAGTAAPSEAPPKPASASERAPSKPVSEPSSAERVAAAAAPKPTEPHAAAHAATARTDARGDWAVQLGVFSAEDNARRLAQKANVYGYKPQVASYKFNGRALYRVRLGPYASRAEADATASALSAHGVTAQVMAAD